MNDITRTFVVCPPFHGATLLSLLASRHPAITALGDTVPLSGHLDYWCSCGTQISDCGFWQDMLARHAMPGRTGDTPVIDVLPRITGSPRQDRRLSLSLLEAKPFARRISLLLHGRSFRRFVKVTHAWQDSACELQGTQVCIDGVKSSLRLKLLRFLDGSAVKMLHLVRDPRAFVFSYRKNIDPDLPADGIADIWMQHHKEALRIVDSLPPGDALTVRYEDLCLASDETMKQIMLTLAVDPSRIMAIEDTEHHVIGNRMLATFDGTIELDERYRQAMPASEQKAILARTEPLSSRWHYV